MKLCAINIRAMQILKYSMGETNKQSFLFKRFTSNGNRGLITHTHIHRPEPVEDPENHSAAQEMSITRWGLASQRLGTIAKMFPLAMLKEKGEGRKAFQMVISFYFHCSPRKMISKPRIFSLRPED
jgi:hypothetical protein